MYIFYLANGKAKLPLVQSVKVPSDAVPCSMMVRSNAWLSSTTGLEMSSSENRSYCVLKELMWHPGASEE